MERISSKWKKIANLLSYCISNKIQIKQVCIFGGRLIHHAYYILLSLFFPVQNFVPGHFLTGVIFVYGKW
jgi:hypothetical protein